MPSFENSFARLSNKMYRSYTNLLNWWVKQGREVIKATKQKVRNGVVLEQFEESYDKPMGKALFDKKLRQALDLQGFSEADIDYIPNQVLDAITEQITDMHWAVANNSIEKLIDEALLSDELIYKIPLSEDITNQAFWGADGELAPGMNMRTVLGSFSLAFMKDGEPNKAALRQYLMEVVPSNPKYWFAWAKQALGVDDLDEFYYPDGVHSFSQFEF